MGRPRDMWFAGVVYRMRVLWVLITNLTYFALRRRMSTVIEWSVVSGVFFVLFNLIGRGWFLALGSVVLMFNWRTWTTLWRVLCFMWRRLLIIFWFDLFLWWCFISHESFWASFAGGHKQHWSECWGSLVMFLVCCIDLFWRLSSAQMTCSPSWGFWVPTISVYQTQLPTCFL